MKKTIIWHLGWLFVAMAACADEVGLAPVGEFPEAALTVGESASFEFELRSAPQPPVRGILDLELTVTASADGTPVDGLELSVVPSMPAMGHGSHDEPTVEHMGGGLYRVTRVGCHMPGLWVLDVHAYDGARDVDETVQLTMQVR